MENTRSFQCPNCGSPVTTTGEDREVTCAYCGTSVIVPEELRDKTPPSQMSYASSAQAKAETDAMFETISTVGKTAVGVTAGVTLASVILPIALTCVILGVVGFFLYPVISNVKSSIQSAVLPTDLAAMATDIRTEAPTLAPTPFDTPVPFTKVLLRDNFTDPGSGWDKARNSNYTLEYKNGAYHVIIDEQGKGQIIWRTEKWANETIEVDVQQTAGPSDGQIGLACRVSDSGGLYSFEFSQDGSYGIYKYTDWNSDTLDGGRLDPGTLKPGQVNHLEAVCAGEDLSMLLNGKPILQVVDSQYTSGGVGMVVQTGDSGAPGIDMMFTHLLVKGP